MPLRTASGSIAPLAAAALLAPALPGPLLILLACFPVMIAAYMLAYRTV